MKCLYCTTELPVDGNTKTVICPKCGSKFDLIQPKRTKSSYREPILSPHADDIYGENDHYEGPNNY